MNKNFHLKKLSIVLAMLFGFNVIGLHEANAQVLYSQNFNLNSTGFTGNFVRFTAATACEGGAAMQRNLYSGATTGELISPDLGTSAGGPTTMTYQYKVANWSANTTGTPNPWGNFIVQYGASATGPWTNVQTVDQTTHTVSGSCTTRSVTFTPPSGSLFIRFAATWSAGDYYLNFDNINVTEAAGPCSSVVGGTTNSSAPLVCSGVSFNLSVTGATNAAQTDLSYQWESADDAGFTVNLQSLGTALTQTTSQTTAKYYRRKITCANGGATDYSAPVFVDMNTLLNCYCPSSHSSGCSGDAVTSATLGSLSNSTGASCPVAPAYSYFFPAVSQTTLFAGSTYTLTLTFGSDANQYAGAWIDYNADGTLSPGENIGLTGNAGANGTANIIFTVPINATNGLTRLRIIGGNDAAVTAAQACGASSSTWGETEDYDITIAPPPPCTGPPAIATVSGTNATICPGGSSTLSLSGLAVEGGYLYQWEESSDDLTYNPIGGATNSTYVAVPTSNTYYHCIVTCGNTNDPTTSLSYLVTFDASANAGTASGPATGVTYTNLVYTTTGYLGDLQWQSSNAVGGPYTNISGATSDVLTATSNAAGTFYIRVCATSPTCTTYTAPIMTVVTVANDNVCNAASLSLGFNGPYTNVGATTEVGEPSPPQGSCTGQATWCGGVNANNSVWYSFVAPASGRVSIHFSPGNWDSQIALWSAANCADILGGTATLLAANDDSSGSSPYNAFIAPICLTPGTTYYVQVDGYATTTNNNFGLLLKEENNDVVMSPKVILSGAYDMGTGLMRDSLRAGGLIPTASPGAQSTTTGVLSNNAVPANAIVDWVLLELRDAGNSSTILASRYALLQRDGDVVNTDGVSPVVFPGMAMGNYYVSVKHRNHLGVMTATPANLTFCNASVDFTTGSVWVNPLIVNAPRRTMGAVQALWAGDANSNKNTKYNGLSNDKQFILTAVGAPNNELSGSYRPEDVNLDAKVKYNGLNNDRNIVAENVGVATPNNILNQHTPN